MNTILGIETSCDDTSIAVWKSDRIASVIVSSQTEHREWGGVVPEIASRAHLGAIAPLISEALSDASVTFDDLTAVAVTNRPGLIGSLLVGLNVAKGIALAKNIPIVAVDHLEAHLLSIGIERTIEFPFLSLLVSGGHTMLYDVAAVGEYELLGATRDDAAGEAFDKGAKLMGLGYPGGPLIDRLAEGGDPDRYSFPRGLQKKPTLDFSFSGLKTALRYHIRDTYGGELPPKEDLPNLCASYQEAIIDSLLDKTSRASRTLNRNRIALVGGVSANQALRNRFEKWGEETGKDIITTSPLYSTDNAAMIAYVGSLRMASSNTDSLRITAASTVPDAVAARSRTKKGNSG
jgi:N6-L-threonylcarbamoyladenine synthase